MQPFVRWLRTGRERDASKLTVVLYVGGVLPSSRSKLSRELRGKESRVSFHFTYKVVAYEGFLNFELPLFD